MKIKFKLKWYLLVYLLFIGLYLINMKNNLDLNSLKLCLYSSIFPALVGGTVGNLLFN